MIYKNIPEKIIREAIKYFRETLSGSDGHYSIKYALVAPLFYLVAWSYIYETLYPGHVNIQMFESLLMTICTILGLSITSNLIGKKIDNPTDKTDIILNQPDNQNINIETKQ